MPSILLRNDRMVTLLDAHEWDVKDDLLSVTDEEGTEIATFSMREVEGITAEDLPPDQYANKPSCPAPDSQMDWMFWGFVLGVVVSGVLHALLF